MEDVRDAMSTPAFSLRKILLPGHVVVSWIHSHSIDPPDASLQGVNGSEHQDYQRFP